jgi:hypothetical protein
MTWGKPTYTPGIGMCVSALNIQAHVVSANGHCKCTECAAAAAEDDAAASQQDTAVCTDDDSVTENMCEPDPDPYYDICSDEELPSGDEVFDQEGYELELELELEMGGEAE